MVDSSRRISRREMLQLLGVGGIVLVSGGAAVLRAQTLTLPQASDLDAWLQSELASADLSGIATAWRERHPEESSRESLTHQILAGRRKQETLEAYLKRIIAADYRAGKAELLDGWYLSPTEARLAALASGSKG